MMEPLNYCRHLSKELREVVRIPGLDETRRVTAHHLLDLCEMSEKFLLPDGGMLIEDPELRALPDAGQIRLPYRTVAFEFSPLLEHVKVIVFAREYEAENEIAVTIVRFNQANGSWVMMGQAFMSRDVAQTFTATDSGVRLTFEHVASWKGIDREMSSETANQACWIVVSFLNALQCTNVHVEKLKQGKARKVKSALPFDEYRVLVVDVGHSSTRTCTGAPHVGRSPREHLRRGHIRRNPSGTRSWVNATVVNAGRPGGVISKDYLMRGPT